MAGSTCWCLCSLCWCCCLWTGQGRVGTVLCMALGGPIIDGFTFLLSPVINEKLPLVPRLLLLVLGCVILAFGMTIVIRSEAGTGPNDLVAVVVSES